MSGRRDEDPSSLKPREAAEMWLTNGRNAIGWTSESERDYRVNIQRFLHWCVNEQVEEVGELTPWDLELFKQERQKDPGLKDERISPSTLRSSMMVLKQYIDYLARIGAVDDELKDAAAEAVPTLSKEDATNDDLLETGDALALIEYFRNDPRDRASARHVILEILWHTGCRRGGLRALDLEDYDPEERTLTFVNRPETGTRLKRGVDGERTVLISPKVCEVIDEYIARNRTERRDEHGREPLISGRQSRYSVASLQFKCYLATQPCLYRECPHGEFPPECEYRERTHSSKCPSSRSPHALRTGSITWHRDRGIPIEQTATRVNATPDTIERYYDKADTGQELERRRKYTENLDISE